MTNFKKPLYSALIFFGALIVLSAGYATWNNAMTTVGTGSGLTATSWNAMVDNINDIGGRTNGITSVGGKIGIGITNPIAPLDINGNFHLINGATVYSAGDLYIRGGSSGLLRLGSNDINDQMIINNGNVGIGTVSPGNKLDVVGNISASNGIIGSTLWANTDIRKLVAGSPLNFRNAAGTIEMIIDSAGNVGIGTSAPATKLSVSGNIRNNIPGAGYIELSGDLPGYPANARPTLKTNGSNLYFSAGGAYSAYMSSNGTWNVVSDKNKKENITQLDFMAILNKIDQLPITQWNYKTEDVSFRHIGPFAQDFHTLFSLNGPNDKMISTTDPSGVALAGIKGLIEKNKIQEEKNNDLQKQIEELRGEIKELKSK